MTNRGSWRKVQAVVHTTINHQSKVDAKWYQRSRLSLSKYTSLIPKKIQGETRHVLAATLLAEILAVTAASHMYHVACLALGARDEIPPLPNLPTSFPPPTYQDIVTSGMLKRNRTVRCNPKIATAPHVLAGDYNTKSQAWQDLGSDVQDYLLEMMVPVHPLIALSLAPRSVRLVSRLSQDISLPDEVVIQPWKELDPQLFCTDSFTRHDVETVMVATAEAYNTTY